MKKAKIVVLAERNNLMKKDSLKEFNTRWQAAVKQWKKWRRSVTKGTKK